MDANLANWEEAIQEVRLCEVISDGELQVIPGNEINLEQKLGGWLAIDISVLDPKLIVIGRQVRTDFGGMIDLLCLDSAGDTVVIDVARRKLEVALSGRELTRRRERWKAPDPRFRRGVMAKYAERVASAALGATT